MKKEAFHVCELALNKQGPIASEWIRVADRNALLKLRLVLFQDLIRSEAKKLKIKSRNSNVGKKPNSKPL